MRGGTCFPNVKNLMSQKKESRDTGSCSAHFFYLGTYTNYYANSLNRGMEAVEWYKRAFGLWPALG
jgi:hypothetical protein